MSQLGVLGMPDDCVCLAVHRLLTIHHLVRVSVNLRVKFQVRDMVKLKFMDHGKVTLSIRVRVS